MGDGSKLMPQKGSDLSVYIYICLILTSNSWGTQFWPIPIYDISYMSITAMNEKAYQAATSIRRMILRVKHPKLIGFKSVLSHIFSFWKGFPQRFFGFSWIFPLLPFQKSPTDPLPGVRWCGGWHDSHRWRSACSQRCPGRTRRQLYTLDRQIGIYLYTQKTKKTAIMITFIKCSKIVCIYNYITIYIYNINIIILYIYRHSHCVIHVDHYIWTHNKV